MYKDAAGGALFEYYTYQYIIDTKNPDFSDETGIFAYLDLMISQCPSCGRADR